MKSFMLACLLSCASLFSNMREGDLKDIAKPYLGEYECKSAQLGAKDCLEKFSYIRLELKENGCYTLQYKEKGGSKKTQEGRYAYDKERRVLKLQDRITGMQREFPLDNGLLTISMPIGEKNLVLQFEQK